MNNNPKKSKSFSSIQLRKLLFNSLDDLIDCEDSRKHITTGNRYRLMHARDEVVNKHIKKIYGE